MMTTMGIGIEGRSQREVLMRRAYDELLRPRLVSGNRLSIAEARELMKDFNARNGTDLAVSSMLACTITLLEGGLCLPAEPLEIVIKTARLAIDDCNVGLLNPDERENYEVLRVKRSIAQRIIQAW